MDGTIGKRYDGGSWTVRAEDFQAYARATDDENPAYRGGAAIAPPMFHVRFFIDLMLICAGDPALQIDMLRLVHGEHAMTFVAPLRDGDELSLSAELLTIAPKSSGTVYGFALRAHRGEELVCDGTTSYFVRAKHPVPRSKGAKKPRPTPPPPSWHVEELVAPDQAARYAAASGDLNPIHTDPAVAKRAGLPGVILHGLCTMAFAARDIINQSCGGDPLRLRALSVRFAAPVFPGEALTLSVWEGEALTFVTTNTRNKPVLTGSAEVRS